MTKVSRSGQTKGIRAKGLVTEIEKDSFFVKIHPAGLEERTIKIENKKEHRYNSPSVITQRVSVIFLNENSLKGNYKNKEFNDPYEVIDSLGKTLYQQEYQISKKQKIYDILKNAELKLKPQEQE